MGNLPFGSRGQAAGRSRLNSKQKLIFGCRSSYCVLFFGALTSLFPSIASASGTGFHDDPIASIILAVTSIFFFAVIGRYIARRFGQPAVLGELLMGVLVGNICYLSGLHLFTILREGSSIFTIMNELLHGLPLAKAVNNVITNPLYANQVTDALTGSAGGEYLKIAYIMDIFARYGVIFLLFMVGLESSTEELKQTGRESFAVALIGVLAPMILGFGFAIILLPHSPYQTHLFIAATLSATSVGITARVLSEMKKLRTREARTILGAAMIDDVLGLIILAVVSNVVMNGTIDLMMVLRIIISSVLFFLGAFYLGPKLLKQAVHFFRFLEPWEAKLFISFLFVMILSWLASMAQLAAIIGAFAAGVILHEGYFKGNKETQSIHHLLSPLESILAPIFFMMVGIQVKLETFYNWNVIVLSFGLLVAAIVGKLVCGLGANRKDDRLLIGIGMLPRGEVGLVFASIGRTLGVISDQLFSSIVLMVMITTFIAPPLLKARYTYKIKGKKG